MERALLEKESLKKELAEVEVHEENAFAAAHGVEEGVGAAGVIGRREGPGLEPAPEVVRVHAVG